MKDERSNNCFEEKSRSNYFSLLHNSPFNPGEVNRIFRLANQSKLVEANQTIEIRLTNSIERQSKFHIFFLINSIDRPFCKRSNPFDLLLTTDSDW